MKIAESESPDAKYWPDGDHRTQPTAFKCLCNSDASSKCGSPSSL